MAGKPIEGTERRVFVRRRERLDRYARRPVGESLRAIYDDKAPYIVLSKAAQIGGTTWAIPK